jgi:hypothetical protein
MFIWIYAPLLTLFLICLFLVDTVQILLRAVATMMSAPVLGAHLGSIFMLSNRVATASSLVLIGYLVDIKVDKDTLLAIYASAAFVLALCHIPLLRRLPLLRITVFCFRRVYKRTMSVEQVDQAAESLSVKSDWHLSPMIVTVTTVGFLGLLVPSLLASAFPEYRATLMQTGFIINALSTVLSVLHVERVIAVTLDEGNDASVNALYSTYNISRMLGYGFASCLFVMVLVIRKAEIGFS